MIPQAYRRGFTLVEILVAMAVLAIIMLMMVRIFSDSTKAFDLGIKQAEHNMESRAIMDFMIRELSHAVADESIGFKMNAWATNVYGDVCDEIYFVSMAQRSEKRSGNYYRHAREVIYRVAENTNSPGTYRLQRGYRQTRDALQCYKQTKWWSKDSYSWDVIAENVAGFQVWLYKDKDHSPLHAYDSTKDYQLQDPNPPYDYTDEIMRDELPAWGEIALLVLDEKDASRAADMVSAKASDQELQAFVDKWARRYVARCNFRNRIGHGPGK